jgi:hypothetical protein
MKHVTTWLTFASGCATMAVVAWLTGALQAQAGLQDAIHVCVAEDNVMRLTAGTCPAGQKSMYFKKAGEEIGNADEPAGDDARQDAERVAALERRIKDLEGSKDSQRGPSRVVAPFEVLDRAGKRIFAVEEGTVSLYSAGKALAVIKASEAGGHFMGLSASGNLQASIGAAGARSGVIVSESDVERIYLGKQDSGHYGAKFFAKGGQYVAAIGQSTLGRGLAGVYGSDGAARALMWLGADGEQGHVSVFNGQTAVAEMTVGKTGGGLLTLNSSSGERMVAAGVQPGNFGVVQTGPAAFGTAAGLPLPGSYIAGKQ